MPSTGMLVRLFVLAVPLVTCESAFAQDSVKSQIITRYDRAVFLYSEGPGAGQFRACSAGVFAHDDSLYLAIPQSYMSWLSASSHIGIPGLTMPSLWATLGSVSDWTSGSPWVQNASQPGVCLLPLKSSNDNDDDVLIERLREISIPIDALTRLSPVRGTRLDVIGFPVLEDFRGGDVPDPFVWYSAVATSELMLPGSADTSPESSGASRCFWASPAPGVSFTGGPVFVHQSDASSMTCAGIVSSCRSDRNGQWVIIVPARNISQLIRQQE